MKTIVSWNVNGIRAVEKKEFLPWLLETAPDILCVQETKANPGQLSPELLSPQENSPAKEGLSYRSWWSSAKRPGYSGVAIYSRTEPLDVIPFGYPEFDDEGRVLIAEYDNLSSAGNVCVISAYFPNSQDAGARLPYKLDFCAAMLETCNRLTAAGKQVLLCGDYNIAHKPIDLANPKSNENHAGYLPEERAWMDTFTSSGYIDTFRHFCQDPKHYTWWSYRFHAREKNVGWRIDYHCVNESFLPSVRESVILNSVTGSDHCPVLIRVD
ncbi:MAG: exodeoxyribonuclease III [Spirochaetaceae bacterium]|jgi:exodeoxyribonuclease-3|nr:exodeoxyribonuclease III [Spirochaetaceae bacterium]